MDNFLAVLEKQWRGALILILLILVLLIVVREIFWLMGWGRYKEDSSSQANAPSAGQGGSDPSTIWSFWGTTFIAKTISEFRHLLALLIFLLFSGAVILAILPGLLQMDVEQMTEGLEGVAAALGGLVGSIIGYYFGEQVGSAASRAAEAGESKGEAIQADGNQGEIKPARIPAASTTTENPETKE
jgi:membrane protein DedA with SNARE-associated domain